LINDQWATPTPLRPDGTNLLPFHVNALPPIIGDMAQAIATTTSTDVAMAGTSILSAMSYCFSGVYRMSAKRDHTEPLVLDTLTIAELSFKKSPVMSLIKRPYIQFAHDWNENNKQDIFTSQAERKLLQSKLEALEKKKDVTAEEIAKLQTDLSNIPPSNFRRIAVDDVTPESLVRLLEENGTLLMISDEAGMLGNFSGRYSNNVPNLDLLLKSWNGNNKSGIMVFYQSPYLNNRHYRHFRGKETSIVLKMFKVHNIKTVERERFITMNTTEKKAIVDNILELLIQLTEDGENSAPRTTKAPTADKVEMLTIKESAALISGLSEHTVRQLVKQGKVKSVRTGEGRNGKILVNKADLIAYFNGKGV